MSNEVSKDSSPTYELQPDGSYIRKRNVLFEEDEYVINIGPQHPATHGVLRFRVSLEGEIIRKLDVHCGYIHRGIEKMCEELTYPQTLALTDRLDYLGAAQNRHALCMCIEKGWAWRCRSACSTSARSWTSSSASTRTCSSSPASAWTWAR